MALDYGKEESIRQAFGMTADAAEAMQADPLYGSRVGPNAYAHTTATGARQIKPEHRVTIEGAISGLENMLFELAENVERLETALQPFLRPVETSAAPASPPDPCESQVASKIYECTGRVSDKSRRLFDLFARIDL